MFFRSRHERELSEIKGLTGELALGVSEALERLGHIHDLQLLELAARATQPEQPLIAFVHIPKTAGATVTNMFARAYSKAGVHAAGNYMTGPAHTEQKVTRRPGGWEVWQRKGGRVTVGHVPYRVFRRHLPVDALYMTFLREPVDRVLSHYYRHIHHPHLTPARRRQARDRGRERAAALEEALVEMRLPQLSNLATRFLCGHPSRGDELAPSALDDAKAALRNFAFVGIQERFEESVVLLQRTLGLDLVPYMNRHVSVEGGRPAVDEIPAEQRALIEEHNRLDLELYRFGLELFEDAVRRAGDGLVAEAEQLLAVSTELNDDAIRAAREWLDRELPPGTARPAPALRLEAKAAGVPIAALKHVMGRMDLRGERKGDDEERIVRRPEPSPSGAAAGPGPPPGP
jgi:hypothetical protein